MAVVLGAQPTTAADIRRIAAGEPVELADEGLARVAAARAVVEATLAGGEAVYGLTTRLGAGRDERVTAQEQEAFQRQVVANHRGGTGEPLPDDIVRALIAARLAVLLNGGSGVRVELVRALAGLLDADAVPRVPERGSVGAADLTHLAVLLATIQDAGLSLAPHDAAAFLSANALSIGRASLAAGRVTALAAAADRALALSVEAIALHGSGGAVDAFDDAIAVAGGGAGQRRSAARIRAALDGGPAATRGVSTQDPLAFRTAPQLHGALIDELESLEGVLARALAARSENPLVDVASGRMISGGNFDGTTLVLRLESLRLAVAIAASAAERRIAALSDALRPFRRAGETRLPGLTLYAAADALAEIRQLAAPVALGASPLSGVEDTASFAPAALRLLERSIALGREVLAIEALHAAELARLTGQPSGSEAGTLAAVLADTAALPASEAVEAATRLLDGDGDYLGDDSDSGSGSTFSKAR